MPLSPDDFGASFKNFMNQIAQTGETAEFASSLKSHFNAEPSQLAVVSEQFDEHEHPNVQIALNRYLCGEGRSAELLGVAGSFGVDLATMAKGKFGLAGGAPTPGPVAYTNIQVGDDDVMPCVEGGLYLICDGEKRLAVLLKAKDRPLIKNQITLEVMAANRIVGEEFLKEIRTLMRSANIYRGRVLSMELTSTFHPELKFHSIKGIDRDSIILPKGLLERIERSTLSFANHSDTLKKWKRHLRRGLLLYGPPGTGKTLTAMYLASSMGQRTVLLVTGRALGFLNKLCQLARALQPSMVLIEDVDLIAGNRNIETTVQQLTQHTLLFELLNEMDGLAEDTDTIFLLTTNRPEILEPALAQRPGRIDSAFELPLPDAECRERLFRFYSEGMPMGITDFTPLVKRSEGASPAFIKELMRIAASYALDENADKVGMKHLDDAMNEMVLNNGKLSRLIAGFEAGESVTDAAR